VGSSAQDELVGRRQELERLDSLLAGLGDGAATAVLSGEAGIGKTRLLTEACELADSRGHLVLSGRAAEFSEQLPFAAFVDALDDYLGSLQLRSLGALEDEQLAELSLLFPGLSGLDVEGPSGLQDERYRSHRAVRGLLEALAARQPVVLALDDLHWSDTATLELLAHLLRRPPQAPVAMLLAFRPGQVDSRLDAVLADAEREGMATRLELQPLSREQADRLVGADADPALRAQLHRLSGGNPFYLGELMRAGVVLPAEETPSEAIGGVPPAVASALERELEAIPEAGRQLAQGAAVAGETFDVELAAEAAGMPERDALAAVDELIDSDVLRATDAPRRFRFRHPIVHRAVYQAASEGWRLGAHERVAAALEQADASPLARAPHVEASARPGDAAAIELLRAAGDSASLRAPAAASHWYEAALRLVPEGDEGARLGLLVPMAQALGYAGRLDDARRVLEEVLVLLPNDQVAVRGQVAAAAARVDQLVGSHEAARTLLLRTLDEVPDRSSPEATEVKLQLAGACFFNGDFDGLKRWIGEALSEADARDDRSTRAAATGTLGCAEYMIGDMAAARARLDEANSLFDKLSEEEIARRLHSLTWCGMTELYLERFARATTIFERVASIARVTGHGHVTTLTRIGEALVLLWRGRLAEATDLLDGAIEAATLTANDQFLTWALWARCWCSTLGGDIQGAIDFGRRAVDVAAGAKDPVSVFAACYLAEARFESGDDPAGCRDEVLDAVGGPELEPVERGFKSHWYELLTRMDLAAGDLEAADDWARRALEAAEGLGIAGRSAEALRARTAVELARGETKPAAASVLEAAELAAAGGLPIEEARCRTLAGRALAPDDRDAAVAQLDAAVAVLDRLGAARYRDEAQRELRALGKRTTRPKRAGAVGEGVTALSQREREVASLVADGRTNKEIAGELYLSEKTVESHLSRIFGKLEVSKRAQVAAAMERQKAAAG
jgi:DNA-binding CsgD family transcriptional regulator/tetratricopeptide (TPR) repeat protein